MTRLAEQDIEVVAGDDEDFRFRFTRLTDSGQRVAVSVRGREFAATVRLPDDTEIPFTVDDTLVDDGVVVLSLSKSQTRIMGQAKPRRARWDFQQTISGKTRTLWRGRVTIQPEVTA